MMRWSDLYAGLLAASFALGAVLLGFEGAPWYGAGAMAVLSALFLGLMLLRSPRAPKVVLVGDPAGGRLFATRDALDREGFAVASCPGPAVRDCPALHGGPCPLGDHPVAALLCNAASYTGPAPPCGDALRVPQVTVVEGSPGPLVVERAGATIGGAHGPEPAARAVRELIGVA